MSNLLLTCKNLDVGYDKRIVATDISLDICEGEIVSLIGSNGVGKSTILKTISGMIKPIAGEIKLFGNDLANLSGNDIAKAMAVVFPEDGVREAMTCRDVVALGRYPYTGLLGKLSSEDEIIIDEAMKKTSVDELSNNLYTKISDGQRQRVLLARALCQQPKILLLDEPTTYLDVKYRLEFLSMLYHLAKQEKIAVIMSIHELDMARQISDRIIALKNGRVHKTGSPDEVFTNGYVNELFDISIGNYDESCYGAILEKE